MCFPLKKVLNKIEDSYQTYINSYKTHTLATCHGGTGKPLEKVLIPRKLMLLFMMNTRQDVNDFENIKPDHHASLRDLTHEIDHL